MASLATDCLLALYVACPRVWRGTGDHVEATVRPKTSRMSRIMRPNPMYFLCTLLSSFVVVYSQDKATKDISAVYAEGKVSGSEYTNGYFGLTLLAGSGKFTEGGFVSAEGKRARLIDVQANPDNWQGKFEIAVLADSLAANPLIHLPKQYVRAVRHQFEKQGMETEKGESPAEVADLTFVRAVLKVSDGSGHVHRRAIYTTFLKGYILSLDVSAATSEEIEQLVAKAVQFKSKSK